MTISKLSEIKNFQNDCDNVIIEEGVKLKDVYIKAKKLIIKAKASLTDCKLFSEGTITIGEETIIKEKSIINAFKSIKIGDRTMIDRDVFIGGMQSEKSQIKVGNDCVILYRSYLNTTCNISIGNNVGIGGYCLIFTHSAWKNALEGHPYKFADVMIKDNVWIPWHVIVFPSVTIEENVIVGGGSVVSKSLPPNVFAAGNPAKIIKEIGKTSPSTDEKNRILLEILNDFCRYAKEFLMLKEITGIKQPLSFDITFEKTRLIYTTNFDNLLDNDVIISLKIPDNIKKTHEWIELDTLKTSTNNNLAKHFLNFIKRYGIRIHHYKLESTNSVHEQEQQIEERLNVLLFKGNGKKYSSLTISK
jgi:acetyltransferase-like isoleucine patch superfamily enzyme